MTLPSPAVVATVAAVALAACGCGAAAAPAVGVNYNGLARNADFSTGGELERVNPTWVRAFVDMDARIGKSEADVAADPDILAIRELSRVGYHTIVSLKWPMEDQDFPQPETDRMESYFAAMRHVLNGVGAGVDIVVSGNEPFRETKPAFRDDDMVWFYKRMTTEINTYRSNNARSFSIYVGSFNNVYDASERTAPLNSLIAFADATSWIAGIDLHVHHNGAENMPDALAWARSRIAASKRILVTEYSLVRHWKEENSNPIPAAFAQKYGYSADMLAYQYLDMANKTPVPRAEWVDYMSMTPWIENRKHYLANMYAHFKEFAVAVATYGMRQSRQASVTATTDPWSYNPLFCSVTCKPNSDGGSSFNYAFIDDFRAIRNGDLDAARLPGLRV